MSFSVQNKRLPPPPPNPNICHLASAVLGRRRWGGLNRRWEGTKSLFLRVRERGSCNATDRRVSGGLCTAGGPGVCAFLQPPAEISCFVLGEGSGCNPLSPRPPPQQDPAQGLLVLREREGVWGGCGRPPSVLWWGKEEIWHPQLLGPGVPRAGGGCSVCPPLSTHPLTHVCVCVPPPHCF